MKVDTVKIQGYWNEFISLLTPERKAALRYQLAYQILPSLVLTILLGLAYYVTRVVPPGWITYWASFGALVIVWLTAVARLNDIKARGKKWHVRRLGMLLVGLAATGMMAMPLFPERDFPSWMEVGMRWGLACAWLTTPNMVPWWKYISGTIAPDDSTQPPEKEPQL